MVVSHVAVPKPTRLEPPVSCIMSGLTRESVHYYCALVFGKSAQQDKEVAGTQEPPAPGLEARAGSSAAEEKRMLAAVLPSGRALPPTPPEPKKRRKS